MVCNNRKAEPHNFHTSLICLFSYVCLEVTTFRDIALSNLIKEARILEAVTAQFSRQLFIVWFKSSQTSTHWCTSLLRIAMYS